MINILVVKLSSLGDVVHTLPALKALRERFPDAHISWVVEEAASGILEGNPNLDEVIIFRKGRWFKRPFSLANIKAILAFIRHLRRRHYDIIIDFQGLLKSGVLVFLARGARKVGYERVREFASVFYNEKVPLSTMERHAVDRYLDLVKYLGCDVTDPQFFINISGPSIKKVEFLLSERAIQPGKGRLVGINPTGRWDSKRWPAAYYRKLAEKIASHDDLAVVFIGGEDEKDIVERAFPDGYRNIINLAGKTSLKELAALIEKMEILISNDTGPMHIAAAVGTKVIAIFGPTNPVRTGPYGREHIVLQKSLDCAPCYRRECDTMECMEKMSVDEVFELLMGELGQRQNS